MQGQVIATKMYLLIVTIIGQKDNVAGGTVCPETKKNQQYMLSIRIHYVQFSKSLRHARTSDWYQNIPTNSHYWRPEIPGVQETLEIGD